MKIVLLVSFAFILAASLFFQEQGYVLNIQDLSLVATGNSDPQ